MGKFEFVKLSRNEILEWIRDKWKPMVKKIPRLMSLVNEWYSFHFLSE